MSRVRQRLSFANVVALLALFVALGGTGYAAIVLPASSVGTVQLKPGAVTSGKVKDGTLKAADFAAGQLKAGPQGAPGAVGARGATGAAGATGPAGVVDTSLFHTKLQSDARYLRGGLISVVATSASIVSGGFGSATATCPAGHQAVSGGVEPENVLTMVVTSSQPLVANTDLISLPDGLNGAPTAWRAWMRNDAITSKVFKVMVVCSPIG